MFELLSADQMHAADTQTIASGVSGYALMQAAGEAVTRTAVRLLERHAMAEDRVIVIVAGPGNNGGDGAVAACELNKAGQTVVLLRYHYERCTQEDALAAFKRCDETDLLTVDIDDGVTTIAEPIQAVIRSADLIIDALFGAGLSRAITGLAAEMVELINDSPAPVLAVDLPSGIDANADVVHGSSVIRAAHTVTFFRFKRAHFLLPGKAMVGQPELSQIGIQTSVFETVRPTAWLNDPTLWQGSLPRPALSDHKFARGSVLVRGGGAGSTGASRLSARAAQQCGAGLVTIATPEQALPIQACHLSAVMLKRCDSSEQWRTQIEDSRITATLLGPANGLDEATRCSVEASLHHHTPCVLDADALSAFAQEPQRLLRALSESTAPIVLTPHDGEFERVFGHEIDLAKSRRHQSLAAATLTGAIVVRKGNDTIIASPQGMCRINANAPAWLATAGSGDVLAGITAALLAQGMSAFDAACAAVWIHGDAATRHGYPMTADDLLTTLQPTMNALFQVDGPLEPIGLR